MTTGQGTTIAKRSVSLSKTYPILGIGMALVSALLTGLSGIVGNVSTSGIPANTTGSLDLSTTLPLLSVALQVLSAILFSTPVLLLYVYDKNNGVLEYFLSLGMDQGEIYRQYLKAALILASGLVGFEVVVGTAAGLAEGLGWPILVEVSGLVLALALPAVAFGALIMMSFSSLQKQRVGSNQPLGMAVGVLIVMPAYLVSVVAPSVALEIDLLLAGIVAALSVLMYFSSSRLISREKLLP